MDGPGQDLEILVTLLMQLQQLLGESGLPRLQIPSVGWCRSQNTRCHCTQEQNEAHLPANFKSDTTSHKMLSQNATYGEYGSALVLLYLGVCAHAPDNLQTKNARRDGTTNNESEHSFSAIDAPLDAQCQLQNLANPCWPARQSLPAE